ncbi:MAG: hypothetical protein HQL15_06800 [Candidatus Omnitrophica bacterium]|nr:hypothetical protein [Candidatus Omnitrophota bacterium]
MTPINIYGWDGFQLKSDDLTAVITPAIGGRIMSLKFKGQELLFADPKHFAETFDPRLWRDLSQTKKSLGFRVWGGDKTWVAPQKDWLLGIPPLDLDAAPYALTWQKDEAVMTSPICRETGLQIIRRIVLQQGQLRLTEELYNRTDKPVKKGLWNVTQLRRPCSFRIPSTSQAFRSYHQEDKTLPVFQGDLSSWEGKISVECRTSDLFKVGGIPSCGELDIELDRDGQKICWKKTFTFDAQSLYAHASAVEIFNSPDLPYAEIELHSSFKTLGCNESIRLEQLWQIS